MNKPIIIDLEIGKRFKEKILIIVQNAASYYLF
jgi:hypothetical protein